MRNVLLPLAVTASEFREKAEELGCPTSYLGICACGSLEGAFGGGGGLT